jgi:hypothetical protein
MPIRSVLNVLRRPAAAPASTDPADAISRFVATLARLDPCRPVATPLRPRIVRARGRRAGQETGR